MSIENKIVYININGYSPLEKAFFQGIDSKYGNLKRFIALRIYSHKNESEIAELIANNDIEVNLGDNIIKKTNLDEISTDLEKAAVSVKEMQTEGAIYRGLTFSSSKLQNDEKFQSLLETGNDVSKLLSEFNDQHSLVKELKNLGYKRREFIWADENIDKAIEHANDTKRNRICVLIYNKKFFERASRIESNANAHHHGYLVKNEHRVERGIPHDALRSLIVFSY